MSPPPMMPMRMPADSDRGPRPQPAARLATAPRCQAIVRARPVVDVDLRPHAEQPLAERDVRHAAHDVLVLAAGERGVGHELDLQLAGRPGGRLTRRASSRIVISCVLPMLMISPLASGRTVAW